MSVLNEATALERDLKRELKKNTKLTNTREGGKKSLGVYNLEFKAKGMQLIIIYTKGKTKPDRFVDYEINYLLDQGFVSEDDNFSFEKRITYGGNFANIDSVVEENIKIIETQAIASYYNTPKGGAREKEPDTTVSSNVTKLFDKGQARKLLDSKLKTYGFKADRMDEYSKTMDTYGATQKDNIGRSVFKILITDLGIRFQVFGERMSRNYVPMSEVTSLFTSTTSQPYTDRMEAYFKNDLEGAREFLDRLLSWFNKVETSSIDVKTNLGSIWVEVKQNSDNSITATIPLERSIIKDIKDKGFDTKEDSISSNKPDAQQAVKSVLNILSSAGYTGKAKMVKVAQDTSTSSIASQVDKDIDIFNLDTFEKTYKATLEDNGFKQYGSSRYQMKIKEFTSPGFAQLELNRGIILEIYINDRKKIIEPEMFGRGDIRSTPPGKVIGDLMYNNKKIKSKEEFDKFLKELTSWIQAEVKASTTGEIKGSNIATTANTEDSEAGNIDVKAEVKPKLNKVTDPDQRAQLDRIYNYAKKQLDLVNANPDMNFIYLEEPKEFELYTMPTVGLMLYTYDMSKSVSDLNKDEVYKKFNMSRSLKKYKLWHKTKLKGKPIRATIFIDAVYARDNNIRGLLKEGLFVATVEDKLCLCEKKGSLITLYTEGSRDERRLSSISSSICLEHKSALLKLNLKATYEGKEYTITDIRDSKVSLKSDKILTNIDFKDLKFTVDNTD